MRGDAGGRLVNLSRVDEGGGLKGSDGTGEEEGVGGLGRLGVEVCERAKKKVRVEDEGGRRSEGDEPPARMQGQSSLPSDFRKRTTS